MQQVISSNSPNSPVIDQNTCLGVVLAGGQSSRMGQDKSTLMREHTSMLEFSQQVLKNAGVSQIIVSENSQQDHSGVTDIIANAGPLGGIYSVLKKFQPKALLILPVDLPLMDSSALKAIKLAGELSNKACFYDDAFLPLYLPNDGHLSLFFDSAFANFSGKGPSIRKMLKQIPHQSLAVSNQQTLFNANTPQDWQLAKNKFST